MSDLRLITILPPQPVQGVQQPQIAGNSSPQAGIAGISVGSILSGFIINRDSGGNPVLRTDSGDITFASNFFLKIGSEITIRIEHIAGNNSAHILSVNGQAPEVAVLQSGFVQDPEVIVSENLRAVSQPASGQVQAQATTSATASAPLITVSGTIISPALSENPEHPQSILPNGTQVTLKITSISAPTPTQTTVIATPAKPEAAQSNAPSAATATPQSSTPTYASYSRFVSSPPPASVQTTVSTPQPAQQIAIQTTPPQVGQQITTSVISNDPNGEAVIQSSIGIIRLQAGTQLPMGSNVNFEIAEIKTQEINTPNALLVAPSSISPAPITELARSSGALSNIFSLLAGLATEDALNFINKNIPTIGQPVTNADASEPTPHNLMASLLSFTAALRGGDFREWLGRANAKWLENNGHENLLKKAEGEFSSLARQFTQPPPNQWQSLFFPIAIDGELQQVRLFVKRDRKEKDGEQKQRSEDDTRFVLEMDLSQLGEMQMDGFVRRNNQNIQFDLVIRSYNQLAPDIQKNILQIYNDMGELTGYKGNLLFQNVKEFPVNPMEEIISDGFDDVVA